MKYLSFLICLALAIQSCGKKEETKNSEVVEHDPMSHEHAGDPRTDEIMAIHDSIMPKMENIMALKTKLKHELQTADSLFALNKDIQVEKRRKAASSILEKLEKADREMMGWMHQYKADTLKSLDSAQVSSYLQDQKSKIEAVRNSMHQAINEASAFTEQK